jgi:hypothetical protein
MGYFIAGMLIGILIGWISLAIYGIKEAEKKRRMNNGEN